MVHKCSIPRKDVNSAPTQAELTNFSNQVLLPALASINNNPDYYIDGVISPTKARKATIKLLQGLGDTYVQSDHEYIAQALEQVASLPYLSFFSKVIPNGVLVDLMQAQGTVEEVSNRIFTDAIMNDDAEENDAPDYFLHQAFGTAVAAKNKLERKMMNTVLNSFIINRNSGTIISGIQEALQAVEQHKKGLLFEIQAYFKKEHPTSALAQADLSTMSVSKILDTFRRDISEKLQVGTFLGNQLSDLYDDAYNNLSVDANTRITATLTLNAYGAWVALQNFDNFVKLVLGDTIIINPSSETRYEYATKGTNVNTTWRKDDNIDLQAEVNKLTQALINTSPLIAFGTKSAASNAYLQFSDFSYITAKIKDMVFNEATSTKFINEKTVLNYESLFTEDEKRLIRNKSLRHIISSTRYNPQKYIPIVFKILTAKSPASKYIIDDFADFNSQDKTLVWSIYKNMYDADENGMDGAF